MQQMTQQPLNDAQLDRLGDFLEGVGAPAMNLEMLDGFFAALICGPETEVSPHFFLRDQALGGPGGGRRCAHGARFKVIKPEKSADHARQRSIAEVPV
ncbi:yecA family protein (plasmid) [Xanthomonas citri pv. citri]|uniref:UPF0149 family protein n=1 Tax=Xanthomonas TaxID=338 RepID=UPI0005864506|nr:UPF0149 family protein [Xanthomonas citri]AJD66504.1 hypothetical protein J151_00032 [Xanthomonas citri subsp. citri A306]AJY88888.1 yecA family protein [Xanthomonas citri pv. citri]AJY93360.1 yecA family protein [Xanthomonas citri pv. citri]AJY97784.1 yecA family protein [Xanthomonas citri pv. citri]AJZ02208.1 yecA family protein [Xanthomonas citri pv. citri]